MGILDEAVGTEYEDELNFLEPKILGREVEALVVVVFDVVGDGSSIGVVGVDDCDANDDVDESLLVVWFIILLNNDSALFKFSDMMKLVKMDYYLCEIKKKEPTLISWSNKLLIQGDWKI